MKELFGNTIVTILSVAALVASIIWFMNEKGLEPLVSIIASLAAVVASLIIRKRDGKNSSNANRIRIKGDNNKVIQDNKGKAKIN